MSDFPLVSVIIPTYNAENFIRSTIESVLSQSHKNIEIIIVDDCSSDSTLDIIKDISETNHQIIFYSLPVNTGTPAAPRNYGVSIAKGEFIAFIDSDDLWHPEKIALQLSLMHKHSCDVSSTNCVNFLSLPPHNNSYSLPIPLKKITLFSQLLKYQTPTSSLIMHRSLAIKFPFPEDFFFRGREDLVQSLNMHSVITNSLKLNLDLVYYRVHSSQISNNKIIMLLKVFYILAFHSTPAFNIYKILLPFFVLSNAFLSLYFRIIRKKL